MDAKLIVVGGKAQATEFPLKLPTVLGRSRTADLLLNHPLVSRQHCRIFESEGQLMVQDLGSLNGTFIGDTRITTETQLAPGSLLTIGSVTFRAVYGPADQSADELPDFEPLTSAEHDVTVPAPAARAGRSPAAAPATGNKSDSGFNMAWLDENHAAEAAAPAEQAAAPETPAAGGRQPVKRAAAGSSQGDAAESSEAAAAKAAEKPAATAGNGHAEKRDEEDLDDFFRSLSEP